jgi:hypothetical protein
MSNSKTIKKRDDETKLQRDVRVWLNSRGSDYDNGWKGAYKDLMHGGCESGMVSELIYYHDTMAFFKRHSNEIATLLVDSMGKYRL